MANFHKVGAKNKRNGNKLEAATAKQFSTWYQDEFHRSPGSGSLHWRSINVSADVLPPNDMDFPFIIECKSSNGTNWNLENFMQSNQHFPEWQAQAVREAITVKKVPLLVFKRNYVKSFVSFPYTNLAFKSLIKNKIPVAISHIKYISELDKSEVDYLAVACWLDQIMDQYKPKEFEKLFDNNWQQVITKQASKKKPEKSIDDLLDGIDLK